MLILLMNGKTASYLGETVNQVNQHNSFCMTPLLWNPMVKTTRGWGGGHTSARHYISLHGSFVIRWFSVLHAFAFDYVNNTLNNYWLSKLILRISCWCFLTVWNCHIYDFSDYSRLALKPEIMFISLFIYTKKVLVSLSNAEVKCHWTRVVRLSGTKLP